MNEAIRICGCALIFIAAAAVIKETKGEHARLLSAAALIVVFLYASGSVGELISYLRGISEGSSAGKYMGRLLKAGAIAFITDTTADICRCSDESAVAGYVEFAGRAEILLLSLPLIDEMISLSLGLLS